MESHDSTTDSISEKKSKRVKTLESTEETETNKSPEPSINNEMLFKSSKQRSQFEEHMELSKKYRKYVGAHISAAGGVEKAVSNAAAIGSVSFALFLKNQKRWNCAPLSNTSIKGFAENCLKVSVDPQRFVLPHSSYLINLANSDDTKRKRSYDSFIDDLTRCNSLNIRLYNFHPGSTVGACTREESIRHIAKSLNDAHQEVPNVITVIENMSGQKNVIGSTFKDLNEIIKQVQDKSRVGVCLDTCHLFAAGFDVRTRESFDKVMKQFDEIVGISYLKAMHLNDSKSYLGSHLDRHEQIGKGMIGTECFKFIMEDPRFQDMPLILETPEESLWESEINLLYSFLKKVEVSSEDT